MSPRVNFLLCMLLILLILSSKDSHLHLRCWTSMEQIRKFQDQFGLKGEATPCFISLTLVALRKLENYCISLEAYTAPFHYYSKNPLLRVNILAGPMTCSRAGRHLEEGEVRGPCDIPDNARGPLDAGVQERGGYGAQGCVPRSALPLALSLTHQAAARAFHDGRHIGKVHVHQPRNL